MTTTAVVFGFTLTSLRCRRSSLAAAEPFCTSSSKDGVASTGQGAFSHSAAQTEMRTDVEKYPSICTHSSRQS